MVAWHLPASLTPRFISLFMIPVELVLSEQEYLNLTEAAAKAGVTVEEFIRSVTREVVEKKKELRV